MGAYENRELALYTTTPAKEEGRRRAAFRPLENNNSTNGLQADEAPAHPGNTVGVKWPCRNQERTVVALDMAPEGLSTANREARIGNQPKEESEMAAEITMQSAEEMRDHLVEKSVADEVFRAELVSDPKKVIHQEFGIEVPDDIQVRVHENDMHTVHLALPPSAKLYEAELEQVAGGFNGSTI